MFSYAPAPIGQRHYAMMCVWRLSVCLLHTSGLSREQRGLERLSLLTGIPLFYSCCYLYESYESLGLLQSVFVQNFSHLEKSRNLHVVSRSLSLCCCRLSAVLTRNTVVPMATHVTYQQEVAPKMHIPYRGIQWLWGMLTNRRLMMLCALMARPSVLMVPPAVWCNQEIMAAVLILRCVLAVWVTACWKAEWNGTKTELCTTGYQNVSLHHECARTLTCKITKYLLTWALKSLAQSIIILI